MPSFFPDHSIDTGTQSPIITAEAQRLMRLRQYAVLDTPPESSLDELTEIAAHVCQTPIALISLVDEQRQWFKAKVGLTVPETPREIAFCAYAIQQTEPLIVPDASQDPRFQTNPLVVNAPHIRFYAGVPLITLDGYSLGTLCVIDRQPRHLTPAQIKVLTQLAHQVMTQLELRRALADVHAYSQNLTEAVQSIQLACTELEQQVVQRTEALMIANHQLQSEIQARLTVEHQLRLHSPPLEHRIIEPTAALRRVDGDRDRIFNLSLDIMCIAGTDGYFKQVNPAFCKLLGYNEADLLSQPFLNFVHPEDVARTHQEVGQLATGATTMYFENRYRHRQGGYCWLAWKAVPVVESKLIYAIGRDITERKQAEQERLNLLHREQLARTVAETTQRQLIRMLERITDAFFAVDSQGQFTYANPQAGRLLQTSPASLSSQNLWEVFSDQTSPAIAAACQTAMRDRRSTACEAWYAPSQRWLAIHAYPSADGLSVYLQDVTARRQAEQTLRHSEARYRLLFDSNPHPMWVYDVETLRFLAVNAAAVTHYGYTQAEFLRMTLEDVRPSEDVPALHTAIAQPTDGLVQAGIWRHRCRDGSLIWVDVVTHPLQFDGRSAAMVLVNDVTQRLELEQQQEATSQLQRAILDSANYTIISTDKAGIIQTFNATAERLLGYTAAEVVGRCTPEIIHDRHEVADYAQQLSAELGTAIAPGMEVFLVNPRRGRLEEREWTYVGKDGHRFPVLLSVTTLRDAQGNITGFLGIGSDITERKRLESQFLRAQRLESVGTLASGIAHDLNNVLAPILMSIQLLQQQVADPKGQRWLQTIETSTKRGAHLVKQVLSFTRGIESDSAVLHVPHLVQEVEHILQETLPAAIALQISTESGSTLHIQGDATQMHQVLMNLAVNSRDAMPQGGELRIQVRPFTVDHAFARQHIEAEPGDYVEIAIIDTGIGMDEALLDRVFEPFFTTKPRGKGTGLGLSTVLGIIRNHQGFVSIHSRPQQGTDFRIYLPRVAPAPTPYAPELSSPELRGAGQLVLVADDEAPFREMTRAALEAHNYIVITAADGIEAIAQYDRHRADIALAIIDLGMPTLDGVATIRALTQLNPHLEIIATSGLHTKQQDVAALGLSQISFLPKPYSTETLLHTLQAHWGTRSPTDA